MSVKELALFVDGGLTLDGVDLKILAAEEITSRYNGGAGDLRKTLAHLRNLELREALPAHTLHDARVVRSETKVKFAAPARSLEQPIGWALQAIESGNLLFLVGFVAYLNALHLL